LYNLIGLFVNLDLSLAHFQLFVLVGVQAEGIRIIRLGGITVF
jgi:hypothetical protein